MSQTIFFLSPHYPLLKPNLKEVFQVLKYFSVLTLIIFFISSCSSQAPKNQENTTATKTAEVQTEIKLTSNEMLEQAKGLLTKGNQKEAIVKLVSASELLLIQGETTDNDYRKALWLANKVLEFTLNNQEKNIHSPFLETYALMLIRSQSLLALGYTEPSHQQIIAIKEYAERHSQPLTLNYYQTQSNIWQKKNRPVESLLSELYAFSLNKGLTIEQQANDVSSIWHKLTRLTPWQIALLNKKTAPHNKGWLALIKLANRSGNQLAKFQDALIKWQIKFPAHPANIIAQQLSLNEVPPEPLENIAILLPLSGSQALAGLTAQQGILAAYQPDGKARLHFLDTHDLDWSTLTEKLNLLAIDFVIGPLLKKNLDNYLALDLAPALSIESNINDITKPNSAAPLNAIPTLLLNTPKKLPLAANQFALSMRPEDEGTQAAASLSHNLYKNPIVLSHNDAVSKRIAEAFITQWHTMSQKTIDVVYFDSDKTTQKTIKTSLDVSESEARINELKSHLKYTLKTQARNRRDIDMIYLIGSAEVTRLVKPYIEVNISPFAENIPVYASSRSHSIKGDNNSNNDLQGLTFTEVPWLLNSNRQNKALASLTKKLWPNRSDSYSRLFALGYDSYKLMNTLSLMRKLPYIRHYGQTGILQLNADGVFNRTLLWGQYTRGKVVEVEVN